VRLCTAPFSRKSHQLQEFGAENGKGKANKWRGKKKKKVPFSPISRTGKKVPISSSTLQKHGRKGGWVQKGGKKEDSSSLHNLFSARSLRTLLRGRRKGEKRGL